MSNRVHIICHPWAGNGQGRKVLKQVYQLLSDYQMEYLTYETNYATHAEVITKQILAKIDKKYPQHLLVIGGDGTLHEVVTTLIKHQSKLPINYIAAGTGNDFQRTWQKDQSVADLLRLMLFTKEPSYIPILAFKEHYSQRSGAIVNNMGFGLDAQINFDTQKNQQNLLTQFGLGHLNYLLNIFTSLTKIKHFDIKGAMDGVPFTIKDVSIASILNTASSGGGIILDQLTEAAKPEIVLVTYHSIKLRRVFELLWRVLIRKNQHLSPSVSRLVGQHLQLKIASPIIGHVDGEVLPEKKTYMEVSVTSYPFILPPRNHHKDSKPPY